MLERFLPTPLDNTYRGRRVALWLFAAIVILRSIVALNSVFDGYDVAVTADGIPLDTYTPAGARAVVSAFAAWGLAQLVICLLCALVLIRYRALVPFMFALLLLEHLCRRLVFLVMPIERAGSPPAFYVNLVFLALMAAGLVLSLPRRDNQRNIS